MMIHDILFFVHRLDTKSDFVVGDDVLDLHPDAPYNIHFPFKRGDINVHDDVGGSKTAILANLEAIWTYCVLSVPLGTATGWQKYAFTII